MLKLIACVLITLTFAGCSSKAPQPTAGTTTPNSGSLQPGQASGTFTANGQTVELKYAYAGKDQRFGRDSIVILLTDKPIPPAAITQEIKNQTLLQSGQLRGLEYAIDEDGMWVRFHSSPYQESSSMQMKDYAVEGDIVRGVDENDGSPTDGRYSRSVKFVASIVK